MKTLRPKTPQQKTTKLLYIYLCIIFIYFRPSRLDASVGNKLTFLCSLKLDYN